MTNSATLRGVTVGEGTDYPFAAPPQLPGVTARQTVVPVDAGGATFSGPDVAESGSLPLEVYVNADTPAEVMPLVDVVVAAWSPSSALEQLTLLLEGQSRIYVGRPGGAVPDLRWLIEGHLAAVRLVFTVSDPLWYGPLWSVTVSVGGASGGMATPMVTPMVTTGSGSTGDAAVTNTGTAPAHWTASLTGGSAGVVTPRLMLNGQMVEINGTIPAGSVLTVDSRDRYIALDGQPRQWASYLASWWQIPPGQSTFSYRAVSGDGTATLTSRPASY